MTAQAQRRWARTVGGAVVLLALLLHLGTQGVSTALHGLDVGVLVAGAALAAVTTVVAAWRWRVVAGRLGVPLSMPSAVAACYRAQFLNVTLPAGVLGDVDRAVHHGRLVDDVGRALRAVAWERTAGQVVLAGVTLTALAAGGSFTALPLVVAGGAFVAVGVTALARWSSFGRVVVDDARRLSSPSAVLRIAAASLVVVGGHVVTFTLAARAVGVRMPLADVAPLALLVLVAAGIPLNLAGWGPREGVAAWAFAASGSTASQGLAVAVAFGVIVLVGTLPGAALLLVARSRRPARTVPTAPTAPTVSLASADAAAPATFGADARREVVA
ncbi:lysylphosphatidylglycerol synthase transmembrane domain-containing protein [Knoellia sp. Soil729]|uniref:lysylphosphatidylglycerol synthase transmembrane domain-containing protein n=1 Tax=Knoellia sp. Soil729 TaxID=1736394 RepID=UPI0009E9C6BD|nr:lysylphosphatidylglycerol synthase transmembrane domain-containing protein [Knoellia sp. Soil729]